MRAAGGRERQQNAAGRALPWMAAAALVAGLLTIAPTPASAATPLTVRIVNNSGVPDAQVYLLASADGPAAASIPVNGTGIALTSPGITQVSPGSGGTGGTYEITMTNFIAGSLWLSYCSPVGNAPRPSPMTSDTRFDQVELTYNGTSDQSVWSDLTAVSMWGLPIDLAFYDGASRLAQFDRTNGSKDAIVATLTAAGVQPAAVKSDSRGHFLRIISPVILASAYPSVQDYVRSVAGLPIVINGIYSGGGPNAGPYSYSGTFEADGSITLNGTISQGGLAVGGSAVRVQGDWLWGPAPGMPGFGIYMQNGPYSVAGAIPNGGALSNDVYGAIYRDLVVGFAYGYWGGKYGSSTNGFTMDPRTGAYANARTAPDPFSPAWNVYDQAITQQTTAYGMPFGDTFVPVNANPLVNGPTNVSMMQVTLRPDGATCASTPSSAPLQNSGGSPPTAIAATPAVTASTTVATPADPTPADPAPAAPEVAAPEPVEAAAVLGDGLTLVPAAQARGTRLLRVDEPVSVRRSAAPTVTVRRGGLFSLIVHGLPHRALMRSQVRVDDAWVTVGLGVTGSTGHLRLPALIARRAGSFDVRVVATNGRAFHLTLRVAHP